MFATYFWFLPREVSLAVSLGLDVVVLGTVASVFWARRRREAEAQRDLPGTMQQADGEPEERDERELVGASAER